MKHRERVWAALHHEVPDRCPMQISFTPEFAQRLRVDLARREALATVGGDPQRAHNPHGGGNPYDLA